MHPNIIEPNILTSPTNSKRIPMARSHIISQESINLVTNNVYGYTSNRWLPDKFITASPTAKPTNAYDVELEHCCALVVHPLPGVTITQYRKLANDPVTSDIWKEHEFGKEFGRMSQGDNRSGTKVKNCILFMTYDKIAQMREKGKKPTYARVVVVFCPQKEDPNRVRITVGGNLIKYAGELTTRTADLTTAKMVWNIVISTEGAKFMGLDIGDVYLETPMEEYEYMLMPLHLFPQHTIDQYKLQENAQNGQVYLEVRRAVYGLPQAGVLANNKLKKFLSPDGY